VMDKNLEGPITGAIVLIALLILLAIYGPH
jgi:hypothetical protein